MNGVLYGRKYRVLISDKTNVALDVSNLHCIFRVEKTADANPNLAECTIYNLSAETEGVIIEQGYRLIIEAGYSGLYQTTEGTEGEEQEPAPDPSSSNYGVIFDGDILQVTRDREDGVSFKLSIIALDGDKFNFGNMVVQTMARNSNPRQIIEAVASSALKPAEIESISQDISPQRLPRGKVLFGEPKKYIRNVAIDNDALHYIDNGKLYVVKTTDPIPETMSVVLTPTSGLIGTPQQDNGGVQIRSLLNPQFRLKGSVKIDNSIVRMQKLQQNQQVVPLDEDGEYLIIKIVHIGDTIGNDWYSDLYGLGRLGNNLLIAQNANTRVTS